MEQILTTTIGKQNGIDIMNAHMQWHFGITEPTTTWPFQNWGDTGNNLWKQRNEADDAWITRGTLDTANFGFINQTALDDVVADLQPAKIHVPIRQTVLQGNVNANNQANFLQIGTGLSINLLASATPLILAFAYGFDNIYGQIDYVSSITSDQTAFWSSLPANKSFLQLYIDRNLSTGVLTGGYTEIATVYGSAPSHFNTQHWYDYSNTTFMKVSDGTNWSNVQRIMVGECVTDADSVTSVTCYAMQGKSTTDSGAMAVNQKQVLTHKLGRTPTKVSSHLVCVIAELGFLPGEEIAYSPNDNYLEASTVYSHSYQISVDNKNITIIIPTSAGAQTPIIISKLDNTVHYLTGNNWIFRVRCEA